MFSVEWKSKPYYVKFDKYQPKESGLKIDKTALFTSCNVEGLYFDYSLSVCLSILRHLFKNSSKLVHVFVHRQTDRNFDAFVQKAVFRMRR